MELLGKLIHFIFQILYICLFVRVLLSWLPHQEDHPIISIFYVITDPMLRPFQEWVPPWRFGVDLSPLFAGITLTVIEKLLFLFIF